jgi:hypothetical protein
VRVRTTRTRRKEIGVVGRVPIQKRLDTVRIAESTGLSGIATPVETQPHGSEPGSGLGLLVGRCIFGGHDIGKTIDVGIEA